MKNATISTSRTRAVTAPLIDYRPLPAAFGDRESLRALRAAKARAARHGEDPSTLQLPAIAAPAATEPAVAERPAARPRGRTLLPLLRRVAGIHRRGRHGGRLLAA